MKILLVDDNPIDLLVNHKVVSTVAENAEIVKKQSGSEAIEYLLEQVQKNEQVDFILLDIKMPLLSGFEMLDVIKEKYQAPLSYLKERVIMVSSSIDVKDREAADESDFVVDFLVKPLTVEKVKACKPLHH